MSALSSGVQINREATAIPADGEAQQLISPARRSATRYLL